MTGAGWRWAVTSDAAGDLEEIESYVLSWSGDASRAEAAVEGIVASFGAICRAPLAHPVYEFPGGYRPRHEYRSANAGRYKVFYRADEAERLVTVWRVRHVSSDFTASGM